MVKVDVIAVGCLIRNVTLFQGYGNKAERITLMRNNFYQVVDSRNLCFNGVHNVIAEV